MLSDRGGGRRSQRRMRFASGMELGAIGERREVHMAQGKVRANRGGDKGSTKARTDRGSVVATTGPTSPLWVAQPTLQDLGGKLIAASTKLAGDETAVVQADAAAATARGLRDADVIAYDNAYGAYVSGSENFAKTPQDLSALGLAPFVNNEYALANPVDVTVKYDTVSALIAVRVKCAPGMHRCVIEIASDQAMTVNVKQFPGDGARQTMGGLAAGTYWVRALHVRASERSGTTGPVAVIVK
jgi:hypothetical protein